MIILLFLAALAVLILSHELGHFIFAKLAGAKVEEFGLGFPPRLFGFKKGETLYSVNLIPFGGFVKILGENGISDKGSEEDNKEFKERSFAGKPIYVRAMILVAGVLFNLLLACILLGAVHALGAPSSVPADAEGAVTILDIQAGSPAEKAGFMPGDKIQSLFYGGESLDIVTVEQVQNFVSAHENREIEIEYLRGNEPKKTKAVPSPVLGVALDKIGIVSTPFYKAFWEGIKDTVFLTIAVVKMFGLLFIDLFKGGSMAAQVMGPVGIAGAIGSFAKLGFVYILQFVALFSVNLAVLNMIPLPALDGGRILFLAIEAIKRKPVSQKTFAIANGVSFILLILLMLVITYRDIVKLIG